MENMTKYEAMEKALKERKEILKKIEKIDEKRELLLIELMSIEDKLA